MCWYVVHSAGHEESSGGLYLRRYEDYRHKLRGELKKLKRNGSIFEYVVAPVLHSGHKTQHTYNVTLRRVRATIFAVEKQQVLHILNVCL